MSDNRSSTLSHEIARLLESIKDEGTAIDTGGGMGSADLWLTSGGVEYFITIRPSNNQLERDLSAAMKEKRT